MPMAASRRSLFPSQCCAPVPLPALREDPRSSSSMAARTSSGMFERQLGPSSTPNEPWPGVLPFAIVPLSLHDSGCVLCSLRAGRDSDGASHDLRAGLLPGGAFVWRAAPLHIRWRFRDSQAFRAPLLSALLCAAFLPIRFRFPFKTLGNFSACCLVLNSRSLL